ncbi:MAG: flagellar basal body rod protein [Rubrivivax sp.]|nr:MAG: flagellar basal body rod protein [Rubrivivax sp.]
MNTVSSIGLSGLNAARTRLDVASHNIANAQTPGFTRQTVTQQTQQGGGVDAEVNEAAQAAVPGADLATDLVNQMAASYAFKANLKTIETEQRMTGSLLDLRA